jgi:WD40 repeat protein
VTALALAPDGNTLGIGYADGTTRLWPLDQPTFDVMLPGPKCDGPVTRIQFDSGSRFVFAHCATGVVAAPRNGPPAVPAKIPGTVIAVSPEPNGDRIRFAAVRGNNVLHRFLPEAFVQTPPPKAKVYAISGKGEEITPAGVTADPVKPAGPTFLAWLPAGKLVAGQPDGAVTVWGPTMKPEPPIREHKAAVRAWAECAESGDFATGDDQGNIGWWAFKAAKPLMYGVFAAPVTGLAFCPTGEWLAATDSTGWVAIWDVGTGKVIHRVKRPTAVKALAAGPYDDLLILASGKTVEVWWLPGFVK